MNPGGHSLFFAVCFHKSCHLAEEIRPSLSIQVSGKRGPWHGWLLAAQIKPKLIYDKGSLGLPAFNLLVASLSQQPL